MKNMWKILRREEHTNSIVFIYSNFYQHQHTKKYYFDFYRRIDSLTKIDLISITNFNKIIHSLKLEEIIP